MTGVGGPEAGGRRAPARDALSLATVAMGDRVSFVVLAHDGGTLVERVVRSIMEQTHPDVELVVVDNASTDGAVERLGLPASVRVLRNARNEGYARGMNQGLALTTGAFVVPCNQDVVLDRGFAARVVEQFDRHPEAAAIAPLVLDVGPELATMPREGTWPVESAAQQLAWDMRVHGDGRPHEPHACTKASGACPAYRRSALAEVSGPEAVPFTEVYDTYGEDVDLACRLVAAGWSTWFDPGLRAGHTLSWSSARAVADKRGRLRVNILVGRHLNVWRHLELRRAILAEALVLAGDVVFVVLRLGAGDGRVLPDVARAWGRVVSSVPDVMRHRRHRHRVASVPLVLRLGGRTSDGRVDLGAEPELLA